MYCLWFLKSAFICEVVFLSCCVIRKISVICVVLTLVLSQYVCIFNINIMYPCFIAGVLVRIYYDGFKRHALWMLVVSGAVWLTMLVAWDATYWDVPEVRNRWFVNILDVPTATVVRLFGCRSVWPVECFLYPWPSMFLACGGDVQVLSTG